MKITILVVKFQENKKLIFFFDKMLSASKCQYGSNVDNSMRSIFLPFYKKLFATNCLRFHDELNEPKINPDELIKVNSNYFVLLE